MRNVRMKALWVPLLMAAMLSGCHPVGQQMSSEPAQPDEVVATYVAIARAAYGDSLITAWALQARVNTFLASPSPEGLQRAREAWIEARVPYQQTEVFRFGNPVVDDWEGRVNSWPLDEGLIDYTAASYGSESDNNYFYTANIIANPQLNIGGIRVDASHITPELLGDTLHGIDGVDANVATGYHAIEFLLWGQDLNGTGPGAGNRPYTDYSLTDCMVGHCERRRDYLEAAISLLVSDLEEMVADWEVGGAAYEDLMAKTPQARIATMLTGMGSLANAELAVERVRLGLLLNDPEEEHDCFSDNTHNSHYYDALGIENVYMGRYVRVNGQQVAGPGLKDLVSASSPLAEAAMDAAVVRTRTAMQVLVSEAEAGRPYDVLIAPDNIAGEEIVMEVVNALIAETREIENIITVLGLTDISLDG